jgi:predicted GNAT family N-acyltransferase
MTSSANNITIRIISTKDAAAYQQVYDLREAMLRKPIGLSLKNEDLSADANDIIIVAEQNDIIIGCLMLQQTADKGIVKLRQMAVAETAQRLGIGRMLVAGAEKIIEQEGNKKIKLHARITAEGFYKNLGYTTTSDVFTEVGIPHVMMEKELN